MKERIYESKYSSIWLENGIIHEVYKENLIITFDVAKAMVKQRVENFDRIKRPFFVDARNFLSIDIAARKFMASREATELLSAGAFYIDNPLARFVGNVFLTFDKPVIPAKLFTNREKALNWLESFKYMN